MVDGSRSSRNRKYYRKWLRRTVWIVATGDCRQRKLKHKRGSMLISMCDARQKQLLGIIVRSIGVMHEIYCVIVWLFIDEKKIFKHFVVTWYWWQPIFSALDTISAFNEPLFFPIVCHNKDFIKTNTYQLSDDSVHRNDGSMAVGRSSW